MGRPRKDTLADDDTPSVPFLNTEKNTGEVDEDELGKSNQLDLGFDEPAVLGVNAIVVEDESDSPKDGPRRADSSATAPKPEYESDDAVTDSAVITDPEDPQPRDNLELITNSDGTLQRANAV